jgi:hypothetical protein
MFYRSGFKQRTVQVRYVGIKFSDFFISIARPARQYTEKESIQVVEVLYLFEIKKCKILIAFMIANLLGFKKFQEQDTVNPGNG